MSFLTYSRCSLKLSETQMMEGFKRPLCIPSADPPPPPRSSLRVCLLQVECGSAAGSFCRSSVYL